MKVLVAIDNKPSSQAIIDALVKMHWYEGTEIHLLTVLSSESESGSGGKAPSATAEEIESLAVEIHNALPYCEVSFVAKPGNPKAVILEQAEQLQAELIVIGSNCKNTIERLLIGSVCQSVLNEATCPVIVAKAPCGFATEASPGFRNILLPIDSSVYSDAAIRWLLNFSWAPDTKFIVSAVVERDTDLEEVKQSLNKRAADLSRFLNSNNVVMEAASGDASQAIIGLAKQYYADLIVMGSHGRTGLQKLILGSVSQAVSHGAPCAVAIVRGLVDKTDSWRRTAAFGKMKVVAPDTGSSRIRNDDDYGDVSTHIMPSGM